MSRRDLGLEAEVFVVRRIMCPNCTGSLERLDGDYPLLDVRCTRCLLRAQVKRVKAKPRKLIRGASWGPVDVYLRTGLLLPPMFVCFDWPEGQRQPGVVHFYPLVPKQCVKRRRLSQNHKTDAGRLMAEYDLGSLPPLVVFRRGSRRGEG